MFSAPRRLAALTVAAVVASLGAATLTTTTSALAAAPPPGLSPVVQRAADSVTADALPTAQIDGVVWAQLVVGNTVYVGGQFGKARPAGSPAGSNEVVRTNLMSYDLTTGVMTGWAPTVDKQVKSLAVSPDGTTLYVGGQFTSINGKNRQRIAAFDVATGALKTNFLPGPSYLVNAIVPTATTVYIAGAFTSVNGVPRNRLAALNASDGALTAWAPDADSDVSAMTLTNDGGRLVVGGRFLNLGGTVANGSGALDPTTGAVLPWAVNQVVKASGTSGGITSVRAFGGSVYATAFNYSNPRGYEGVYKVDQVTGEIQWLADCHGDSYDVFATTSTAYVVSHQHDCTNLGGFPNANQVYWRATAFTTAVTGTDQFRETSRGDFSGQPTPSLTAWTPSLAAGTFTGQTQAAWTVTGTSQYVVMGGEFPTVNGVGQQGLVRFATLGIAKGRSGPIAMSAAALTPTATAVTGSSVAFSIPTAYDRDDATLTYSIYRNDVTAPVCTATASALRWQLGTTGCTDTSVAAETTYSYLLKVTDSTGNVVVTPSISVSTPVRNLALGAATSQSSTLWSAPSSRAVDGSTNGVFNSGSVTHTNADPNSWWQVDLGAVQTVRSVVAWNRTDCCTDRLRDYWVFTSATPFATNLTPDQQAATAGVTAVHLTSAPAPSTTVSLPAGTQARYVMIQEGQFRTYLSLAEVQVY